MNNKSTKKEFDTEHQLNDLVIEAKRTKKFEKLEKFCLSAEYQALPYSEKNYPFITSSKLKQFDQCQLGFKYQYIDLIPKPEGMDDKDYFIVGRAFDDLITLGIEAFLARYVVMKSRVSDVDGEIESLKAKIEECKNDLKKDGTRSATGINAEISALEKIKTLSALKGKTQMTETMAKQVDLMKVEFEAQEMFNHKPQKKVFIWEYAGFLCKAELDDYIENGAINDLKTSANVLNFKPEMYELQAAFYNWGVEEKTTIQSEVNLEVIDKHDYYARSIMVRYTLPTLMGNRTKIIRLLGELKDAIESDIWVASTDPVVLFNSPYYGYEDYGRPTEPIIY